MVNLFTKISFLEYCAHCDTLTNQVKPTKNKYNKNKMYNETMKKLLPENQKNAFLRQN